jgi:hypothetical protein
MNSLPVLSQKSATKQHLFFKENGFLGENRGGKHKVTLYDYFPELEIEAKMFVEEQANKKECSFNVNCLAKHLNQVYHELSGIPYTEGQQLIRSERMLLYDLENWEFRYKNNSNRMYFEGHEREDVVADRERFVKYFD